MAKPIFSFNLLPPKSEKQKAKEEKRSNSLLYASLLLFGITFAWLGIRLVDSALISRSLESWKQTEIDKENEIQSYNTYKSANGQLVLKTRSLAPVVDKHTDPDLVFEFIDSLIKETSPNVQIDSYGRSSEGNFQVAGVSNTTEEVTQIVTAFNAEEQVLDAMLNSIDRSSSDGYYSFIIDLDLVSLSD
ncbi:hypothetical protein GF389_04545 [Candidatus Dojkabacteria bacterium]|nr:hypothetical protein [Candidatus Dojkabacteria bacterium]